MGHLQTTKLSLMLAKVISAFHRYLSIISAGGNYDCDVPVSINYYLHKFINQLITILMC